MLLIELKECYAMLRGITKMGGEEEKVVENKFFEDCLDRMERNKESNLCYCNNHENHGETRRFMDIYDLEGVSTILLIFIQCSRKGDGHRLHLHDVIPNYQE